MNDAAVGATQTATLLLGDVEGSVRHWEADASAAAAAIAQLDELVSEAAGRFGAVRPLEQGEGDSFVLAFPSPSDAVRCALDLQLAIAERRWPGALPVRVRMAVHTGELQLRDDGRYTGHAFNRCARLRALAHGGQVLCSRATRALVVDALPPGACLEDLGELPLRGLARPERVFQVVHPDLPADFPSLRSSSASDNLPVYLSSFVGREAELLEVLRLLESGRFVTLTGAGGSGKTRLAVHAAGLVADGFTGGVWWLDLSVINDPVLVPALLAQTLEVRPLPGQSELDAVVSYLADRRALVLLDNCEHVLEEAARVAEALARGCLQLRVLATSREPLRAEGETEWRVPPMTMPELVAAADSDAVRLFVERASQVRPGFALTEDNADPVVAICRELDGIPLAIELAAARLRALSPEQIASGLADRFRLLSGGNRTALPRQQTLRGSVDWSYELLSEDERMLFRRLGIFAGGFTLQAAEEVCCGAGIAPADVLELVAGLVDKSLVQADERAGAVRYRLLETMRRYALERLEEAGGSGEIRDRHRDSYLGLAERIAPELVTARQPEALDALDPEAANFDAAIEHASATEPAKALRLCVALTLWWRQRFLFAQAESGFSRALEAAAEPSRERARAMWGRALMLTFAGAFDRALPAAQEALAAAEGCGDDATAGRALWLISVPTMWVDPAGSRSWLERARELAAATGDELGLLHATQGLGMAYTLQEEHGIAGPLHAEALGLARRLGQQEAIAWYWIAGALAAWAAGDLPALDEAATEALAAAHLAGDAVTELPARMVEALHDAEAGRPQRVLEQMSVAREHALRQGAVLVLPAADMAVMRAHAAAGDLDCARSVAEDLIANEADELGPGLAEAMSFAAEVRRLQGDLAGAKATAEHALELGRRIGNRLRAAEAELVLGRVAAARGDWTQAERRYHDALPVAFECGTPRPARVLEALAETAAGLESHAEAARLLGAAARRWDERGLIPWPHQRVEIEELTARVREALGEEAFAKAFAEGRAMTADEAVAYVRRGRGERKRPSSGWESLTPTELEVATHAAAGLTNAQIAERMFVSAGTVRTHLSHIFAKLGLRNRAELARDVARRAGATDI